MLFFLLNFWHLLNSCTKDLYLNHLTAILVLGNDYLLKTISFAIICYSAITSVPAQVFYIYLISQGLLLSHEIATMSYFTWLFWKLNISGKYIETHSVLMCPHLPSIESEIDSDFKIPEKYWSHFSEYWWEFPVLFLKWVFYFLIFNILLETPMDIGALEGYSPWSHSVEHNWLSYWARTHATFSAYILFFL